MVAGHHGGSAQLAHPGDGRLYIPRQTLCVAISSSLFSSVWLAGWLAGCMQDLRKNEPERVRGLGDSIMKELTTFYEEGRMSRLDGLEADPKLKALELFQEVSWVGPKKAEELYDNGLRSIEDLRASGQHLLTKQARVCLSRYSVCVCVCACAFAY